MAWLGPVTALVALLAAGGATHAPRQDAPAVPSVQDIAPIPETLELSDHDMRMAVPVMIGDNADYRFVIDTGAERTVIARELAERLGLDSGPQVRLVSLGGHADVGTVAIPQLQFSRRREPQSVVAPALSYRDLGASGLLGVDLLAGHKVSIDPQRDTMTVTRSYRRRPPPPEANEIVVRGKIRRGHLILTDAHYRGRRIRVVIDTGTGISMGNMAMRKLVGDRGKPLGVIPLRSVTGVVVPAEFHQVDRLTIGDLTMRDAPMAFADIAPFAVLGLDEDPAMLLGMDALRLFDTVEIDFANRDIRFRLGRG